MVHSKASPPISPVVIINIFLLAKYLTVLFIILQCSTSKIGSNVKEIVQEDTDLI